MPGTTFGFTYNCTNGATGTFSIADGAVVLDTGADPRVHDVHGHRDEPAAASAPPTGGTRSSSPPAWRHDGGQLGDVHDPHRPGRGPGQRHEPDHAPARRGPGRQGGHRPDRGPVAGRPAVHHHPGLRARPGRTSSTCPAGGNAVQADIPVGSVCTAAETAPSRRPRRRLLRLGRPDVRPGHGHRHRTDPGRRPGAEPDRPGDRTGAAGQDLHRPPGCDRPGTHLPRHLVVHLRRRPGRRRLRRHRR